MALSIHKNLYEIYKSKKIWNCCCISYLTFHVLYGELESKNAISQLMHWVSGRSRVGEKATKDTAESYSLETLSCLPDYHQHLLEVVVPIHIHLLRSHQPLFFSVFTIYHEKLCYAWLNSGDNVRASWFPVATENCRISRNDLCILAQTEYYLWTKK